MALSPRASSARPRSTRPSCKGTPSAGLFPPCKVSANICKDTSPQVEDTWAGLTLKGSSVMGVSMKVVWHVIHGCGLNRGAIDSCNAPEQHVMLPQPNVRPCLPQTLQATCFWKHLTKPVRTYELRVCCAAVGNLSGLVFMDLSSNLLSGTIPQALCTLANASAFNLSSNQFTGERSLPCLPLLLARAPRHACRCCSGIVKNC